MTGKVYSDRLTRDFLNKAVTVLDILLKHDDIKIMSARELIGVTNEDVLDFLSRDPENAMWAPDAYAHEVFNNFANDQTYYFEKLMREQRAEQPSN